MGTAIRTKSVDFFSLVDQDVYRHLWQLPLLAYSFLSPGRVPVRATQPDGFPPVILVHGLGGHRGDFLPLEWYLKLYGRRRVYRVSLGGKRSLNETSRVLARFIQRVCKVNGAEKVDIVAYSLGGIVSRLAILDHALENKIGTLLTLGTPHQGTFPARLLNTHFTRALRPQSEVIQKLMATPWPKGVKGVTFWSQNDLLVQPPEGAAVAGTEQIDMSPFTHFSYLIDPRSWSAIRLALSAKDG